MINLVLAAHELAAPSKSGIDLLSEVFGSRFAYLSRTCGRVHSYCFRFTRKKWGLGQIEQVRVWV